MKSCCTTKRQAHTKASVTKEVKRLICSENEPAGRSSLPISISTGIYYVGKKKYSKEKFVAKQKKSEEPNSTEKIAATKNQKKIANLQYRKQNRIDALNKKITNGNLFMQWGEPLTVFDTAAMNLTSRRIEASLFNKGYFHAKVDPSFKEFRKKRITVVYHITPGPAFIYDSIFYSIPDLKVADLISKHKAAGLLKKETRTTKANLVKSATVSINF